MKAAITVLLTVAQELEDLAKSSMPKMREGEMIKREWFENGVYYRETTLDGNLYQAQFDFRQRKSTYIGNADY